MLCAFAVDRKAEKSQGETGYCKEGIALQCLLGGCLDHSSQELDNVDKNVGALTTLIHTVQECLK